MIWESLRALPSEYTQNVSHHLHHYHSGLNLCCLLLDYGTNLNQFPFGLTRCSLFSTQQSEWSCYMKINSGHSCALEPPVGVCFTLSEGQSPFTGLWAPTCSGFSPPTTPALLTVLQPHWPPGWTSAMSDRLLPGSPALDLPSLSCLLPGICLLFLISCRSLFRFHLPWLPLTPGTPCFPFLLYFAL